MSGNLLRTGDLEFKVHTAFLRAVENGRIRPYAPVSE